MGIMRMAATRELPAGPMCPRARKPLATAAKASSRPTTSLRMGAIGTVSAAAFGGGDRARWKIKYGPYDFVSIYQTTADLQITSGWAALQ